MVIRSPALRSDRHRSIAYEDGLSADARRGHLAVLLVRLDFENARPSHLEPLLDDPSQRAVAARVVFGKIPAERDAGAPGRRIFADAEVRRVHACANVRPRA